MENAVLKDIIAMLRLYNDRHDDVALFRILSSKLFSIKKSELIFFCKKISSFNRNESSKKTYHLINGFDFVKELPVDSSIFLFLKIKIDTVFSQTNIIDLIEVIFEELALLKQAELLSCKEEVFLFKEKLIVFIKNSDLVTIDDIIEFIKKENFEIREPKTVMEQVMLDLDFLILRASLRGEKHIIEKLQKRKEKIITHSEDLDVSYYVEQIKQKKYQTEKELDKIPVFSASQFNTYDTCPNQYRFSYIYSVPVPKKHYFVFGTVMHSVLEEITKRLKEGREVSIDFAKLMYQSLWDNKGYETKEQEEEYKKTGFKIIEQFLKKQNEVDTRIFEIEKKFNIELEKFKIMGFIDRIDVDEKGDYVVIDYKTSKQEKDKTLLRHDIQLLLYYDAVHKLYGKTPKMVGHWYLLSDNVVSVIPTVEDLQNIRSRIISICTSILTENFNPKKSIACDYCDYRLLCNLW